MPEPEPAASAEIIANLSARLAAAEGALAARDKTIEALVTREKDRAGKRRSVFGATGENSALQQVVEDKTLELETQNSKLEQTTNALRETSSLLEVLLENAPNYIYFKDEQSRFVRFSKSIQKAFCQSDAASLKGKTDFDLLEESNAQEAFADEQTILRTGVPIIDKAEIFKQVDGRVLWTLTTKMPWRDKEGRIIGTFGISSDLTAIKTAETELEVAHKQLLESEGRFSGAFEYAPIGVALVSLEGRWIKVNRALCDLVGYTEAELLALTFQNITHPEDLEISLEKIRQLLAGEIRSYHLEKRYIHRQGHSITVLLDVSLVREGRDQPLYFISQFQDVSERKRAQSELEAAHKQLVATSRLAGMAEVATSVLHNVGNVLNSVNISAGLIVESVRKSRVANLAKVVALMQEHEHDLGAYITSDSKGKQLPAYLAQLSEHFLGEQRETIEELCSLLKNIEHIKEIVTVQQSYARVLGVKEVINIRDLVEDGLRMNSDALGRHGVEIVCEFEKVPLVCVDRNKVLQILVNLILNAKHACQDSGRTDRRLTVRVAHGAGCINISVSDNGIGISPENLTRIFNHGFTTRKEGHGFGLHSGALAAKEMGGSLSVASDGPGQGARFTLELPCVST